MLTVLLWVQSSHSMYLVWSRLGAHFRHSLSARSTLAACALNQSPIYSLLIRVLHFYLLLTNVVATLFCRFRFAVSLRLVPLIHFTLIELWLSSEYHYILYTFFG